MKIVDATVLIDGRIADLCRTGLIEGTIYIPDFVVEELRSLAEGGDPLPQARARRALDVLDAMQKGSPLLIGVFDRIVSPQQDEPAHRRLVGLASATGGTLLTTDLDLTREAQQQGIRVLNVNELANALKPVVLPGESLTVHIIKEGKEPGQGIAYLDDGTLVVVENGRHRVGETVEVIVTSVLQTVAGKMIFSRLRWGTDGDFPGSGRADPLLGPRPSRSGAMTEHPPRPAEG